MASMFLNGRNERLMLGGRNYYTVGCCGLWLCCFIQFCRAGVVVKQNISPGATSWPGAPTTSTMANPSSSATVSESFNGGGGNTNLSQTFIVSGGNFTLQSISIYAGGGTGTGGATNLVLK